MHSPPIYEDKVTDSITNILYNNNTSMPSSSSSPHPPPRTALDGYSEDRPSYVVGIMSGTSLDGIDMCLCELTGSASRVLTTPTTSGDNMVAPFSIRVVHFSTASFPTEGPFADVKPKLKKAMSIEGSSIDLICDVNFSLSRLVASCVLDFLKEVDTLHLFDFSAYDDRLERIVLGSHGQTVWHTVTGGSTLQIGDTEVLAHAAGMVCVGNFRAADVAVGGQGAPLVPFFDSVVARLNKRDAMCFQNLGGIGNVTYVSPTACVAFDTGPANVTTNELLDIVVALPPGHPLSSLSAFITDTLGFPAGSSMYDRDAIFSSGGVVLKPLLDEWLSYPAIATFRSRPPPKSTGRELFGAQFVQSNVLPHINDNDGSTTLLQSFKDVMRTLIYLAAYLVAESYERFLPSIPDTVVVSGGGRRHPLLLQDIQALLDAKRMTGSGGGGVVISSLGDLINVPSNIDADDAKEAIAFAVFAHERMLSLSRSTTTGHTYFANIPAATGASKRVCLGQVSIPL